MIELQALVSTAVYGTPKRSANRLQCQTPEHALLAVLEKKRAGFKLGAKDVFLNITGGIGVDDPAIDLAVVAAVLSSNIDVAIDKTLCFAAEIGLAGEVRPVTRIEQRILKPRSWALGPLWSPNTPGAQALLFHPNYQSSEGTRCGCSICLGDASAMNDEPWGMPHIGWYMGHPWVIRGLSMGYPWVIRGLSLWGTDQPQ